MTIAAWMCSSSISSAVEPVGVPWKCHIIDDSSRGVDGVKLGDINGGGLMDIATDWEEGGITRAYLNPGSNRSKAEWPAVTVGKTASVEDAVFADLDGDGSLDVVSCYEGKTKSIFVHRSPTDEHDLLESGKWKQAMLADSKTYQQMWRFAWPMKADGKNGMDLIARSKGKNATVSPIQPRPLGLFPPAPEKAVSYQWTTQASSAGALTITLANLVHSMVHETVSLGPNQA